MTASDMHANPAWQQMGSISNMEAYDNNLTNLYAAVDSNGFYIAHTSDRVLTLPGASKVSFVIDLDEFSRENPFWLASGPETFTAYAHSIASSTTATESTTSADNNYSESNYTSSFGLKSFIDDSLISIDDEWWQ